MDDSEIAKAVAEYEAEYPTCVRFADALRVVVSELVSQAAVETDSVTGRAKEPTSVRGKFRRHESYFSLEDVTDKVGVRVVTRYSSDVDRVCDVLTAEFGVLEDVDHRAASVETFGYSSRHLVLILGPTRKGLPEWRQYGELRAEVQVRSILQHAWASISHGLDYKSDKEVPDEVRRKLFRVAALLETGDDLFDSFRNDVTSLRASYAVTVERNEWQSLPLNLDSLLAAGAQLRLTELAAAATEASWLPSHFSGSGMGVDDSFYTRLIAVADACGLKTAGDVALVVERLLSDRDWVAAYAERADKLGYRPFAVSTDVIALRLMSEQPSQSLRDLADRHDYPDALVDAAMNPSDPPLLDLK